MTVKELAGRLEVGLSTVYSLLATGQIRHRRIGKARGVIRIDEDAYQDYLARVERAAEGGGLANPPPPPTRSAGFQGVGRGEVARRMAAARCEAWPARWT